MSAREDVLDALEQILIDDGPRAATLDAVATRAEVSKGGLLYHFGSQKALVEGLADRLRDRAALDVEAMHGSPEGPSVYYVRSSVYEGSDFDRTLIAASRLVQGSDAVVSDALAQVRSNWLAIIRQEVGDESTAEAILLIGDGLYYNALLGGEVAPTGEASSAGEPAPTGKPGSVDVPALVAVVERLKSGAA